MVQISWGQTQALTPETSNPSVIAPNASVSPTPDIDPTPPTPPSTTPITPSVQPSNTLNTPIAPSLATPSPVSSTPNRMALSSYPKWSELKSSEQTALKPLFSLWPRMTSAHKNKWLALSANFAELSPSDQEKLQNRMTQWGSLTSEQRTQARIIFNQVQQIPSDDRLSKWQAYQALDAKQRGLLAQDAAFLPHSAAIAPKPHSSASINKSLFNDPKSVGSARIELDQISSKTLLPPRFRAPAP